MKKIKFLGTFLMFLLFWSVMISCDKDDVDEFTSSVIDHPWVSENGEVYDFYDYFKGNIYNSTADYASHKIDKSFIWSEANDNISIGIDGYRNEEGEMVSISSEDMVIKNYHIDYITGKQLVLSNTEETITLTAYK